jgi:hypothetical protein
MTESRTYVTEDLWFPCDKCGDQITHHSFHTCFSQTDLIVLLREEVTLMQKYLEEQNLREHFVAWRSDK